MGMKAIPASNLVVETLGLQGQLTPEKFLKDRELILHKTFETASLMPGTALKSASLAFICSVAHKLCSLRLHSASPSSCYSLLFVIIAFCPTTCRQDTDLIQL